MAQFPAMPFFTDAYLADTSHLTTIEHGAYLLLLITMWRAGGVLPNDDRVLARYARMTAGQWQRIKPTVMSFFTISSDGIRQGRLTDELAFVRQKGRKQSDKARARWLKNKDTADATAMPEECRDDAEGMPDACPHTHTHLEGDKSPSLMSETSAEGRKKAARKSKPKPTYDEPFDAFWRSYPRTPNMSKPKAAEAWGRLGDEDRTAVVTAVPKYRAFLESKPDHPVMHATTFINERRFEGFTEQATSAVRILTDQDWQKRLVYAREKRAWFATAWGAPPGADGCTVPQHLIQTGDGDGWASAEA